MKFIRYLLMACLMINLSCELVYDIMDNIIEKVATRPISRTGLKNVDTKLSFNGNSSELKQTKITPILDCPINIGENLIWCASFQSVWKELQDSVLGEPVKLSDNNLIVQNLNNTINPSAFIPKESILTASGIISDELIKKVKSEFRMKFPDSKQPVIDKSYEGQYLIYSYLAANIKFDLPYFQNRNKLTFTDRNGNKTKINSFGIRAEDDGAFLKLRKQPLTIYQKYQKKDGKYIKELKEFIIDLDANSNPNQIIIAMIEPKGTLEEVVLFIERKIHEIDSIGFYQGLGAHEIMLIPEMFFKISHIFNEFKGNTFLNEKFNDVEIQEVKQTIEFKLDRSGAELKSESRMRYASIPAHFITNKPFCIYMKMRGAKYPFFVMWIENCELINTFEKP